MDSTNVIDLVMSFPSDHVFADPCPSVTLHHILGCTMNRQGKSQDTIEERMQSANKAFRTDILLYRSKDVRCKIKCRRLVDHVNAVFSLESSGRPKQCYVFSVSNATEKKRGRLSNKNVCELIAESMWRAMGWACDERSNVVIDSLIKVYRWRSTSWWHSLQTEMMDCDLENLTNWKHKWSSIIVETCGIKLLRNGQVQKKG